MSGERLVLDLAAALRADIDVSTRQFFQGRLPVSQSLDVDAGLVAMGAVQ